jgi:predicted hotdog family 3-hydroxylacyl-ACP dehydratase
MGFLVSARDVELHQARVPADAPLLATVRLTAHAGPLSHYAIEVSFDGQPVGRLRTASWPSGTPGAVGMGRQPVLDVSRGKLSLFRA